MVFAERTTAFATLPGERGGYPGERPKSMAGVVLENVSRVFPDNVFAVRGIDLEVRDREFLVLVGPSGCGKTTTLRMIAGLEDLSTGKIKIGSRSVNDVPPKNRDVAMVFQNFALYPHMTVRRNLAFGLELRERAGSWGWLWQWMLPASQRAKLALTRVAIAQRVHETARVLGIECLLERFPRQLSGGERQRVALGRAIVRNPAVFLFDEPLSNLDASLRVEMRRELKQLHERLQTTMIYVTHDQVEALTLGQRIVVMNEGSIQQIGRPMEVYDWPANRFVAGFIGTPGMNFIAGELVSQGKDWCFRRGEWSVSLAERRFKSKAAAGPVVLGVRPEDVYVERRTTDSVETDASVGLVEHLGDATVVTIEIKAEIADRTGAQHKYEVLCVVSKTEPRTDLRPGERVDLRVDAKRIHLFDPVTGENWIEGPSAR